MLTSPVLTSPFGLLPALVYVVCQILQAAQDLLLVPKVVPFTTDLSPRLRDGVLIPSSAALLLFLKFHS